MVLKLRSICLQVSPLFESDVISDGIQTRFADADDVLVFESDVISDGIQTVIVANKLSIEFESDVISDGIQTYASPDCR